MIVGIEAFEPSYESEQFVTSMGTANGIGTVLILQDQAMAHAVTKEDVFRAPYETEIFTFEGCYSSKMFHGIMPDTGASGISTVGEPQLQAL